ncbi:hypothetical protein [Dactylosporangium sp. CA-139066]|uniref:hypothetical protein n=1 Tax=Dactylosporangium sp. CA-139066 TaxID=3239930 RepID=UPI003D8AB74D
MAARVEREHGLVDEVTAERMALVTALPGPGILTARAALLYYGPRALDRYRAEPGRERQVRAALDATRP